MKVELDLSGTHAAFPNQEVLVLGDRLLVEKKIAKVYDNINYRV